jgi:hypothetical protein
MVRVHLVKLQLLLQNYSQLFVLPATLAGLRNQYRAEAIDPVDTRWNS